MARYFICYVALYTFLLIGSALCLLDEPCCKTWTEEGWTEITSKSAPDPTPYCSKNGTVKVKMSRGQTLLLHFKPNGRYGVLGVAACINSDQDDCYVAEIYGLVSGRLGYIWRKHSPNETGGDGKLEWVPGRAGWLNYTVLHQHRTVSPGTWDPQPGTTYGFYVEKTLNGLLSVRMVGGDPDQQTEMSFPVPDRYNWIFMDSYYKEGVLEVKGSGGICHQFERIRFKPGQDLRVRWEDASGALGLSLCTDAGQSECYVLDMFGLENGTLNYWWRFHSNNETGGEGWVPGRETRVKETQLSGGPSANRVWKKKQHTILFQRDSDGYLIVTFEGINPEQESDLVFEVPKGYQHGAVGRLEYLNGDLRVLGPCYNGETFGYIFATCDLPISLREIPRTPSGEIYTIWTPSPGRTKAQLRSPALTNVANLERLCVAIRALASDGGKITVNAIPVNGDSSDAVRIGVLEDNGARPPTWQQVRLSADVPPHLRNSKWILTLDAEVPAEGLLLLQTLEMCSSDGCGIATPVGTPLIVKGLNTSLAEFPWHVGIFRKSLDDLQICGGSLVRFDVVISAAHCFHNESGFRLDKSDHLMAVGKVSRNLSDVEPHQQTSEIISLYIHDRYLGSKRNYQDDIAIAKVKFSTNSVIIPICLDWTGRSLPTLQDGDAGLVAGWGLTERNVESPNLLFARLPFVNFDLCKRKVQPSFVSFLTADKFCAGNINGSTVKKGDSGGGLAFETGGYWYLRGIVSMGSAGVNSYTAFVKVNFHLPWIREIVQGVCFSAPKCMQEHGQSATYIASGISTEPQKSGSREKRLKTSGSFVEHIPLSEVQRREFLQHNPSTAMTSVENGVTPGPKVGSASDVFGESEKRLREHFHEASIGTGETLKNIGSGEESPASAMFRESEKRLREHFQDPSMGRGEIPKNIGPREESPASALFHESEKRMREHFQIPSGGRVETLMTNVPGGARHTTTFQESGNILPEPFQNPGIGGMETFKTVVPGGVSRTTTFHQSGNVFSDPIQHSSIGEMESFKTVIPGGVSRTTTFHQSGNVLPDHFQHSGIGGMETFKTFIIPGGVSRTTTFHQSGNVLPEPFQHSGIGRMETFKTPGGISRTTTTFRDSGIIMREPFPNLGFGERESFSTTISNDD